MQHATSIADLGLVVSVRIGFGAVGAAANTYRGSVVERAVGNGASTVSVLFDTSDRTYELTLRYPTGLKASQPLMTAYSAIVLGLRLDHPHRTD